MASDQPGSRRLRDAVYRPGATDDDRRRYAAALEAERSAAGTGPAPPPARAPRRPGLVVLIVGAAVVGALAVAALVPHPPAYPTVTSTPIALLGGAAAQARARDDLALQLRSPRPFLGLYLAQHRTTLSASLRSDSIGIDGHGTGPTTVSLVGILDEGQATGLMTVLLACDRPGTAYRWVVEGPPDRSGEPVRTGSSGPECGGRIVTSTFVPRAGHVPTRIRIEVPEGVRTVVEVDLSKY